MSKNYLGFIDTRNAKYQGFFMDEAFNGIGILIDNVFTTIVTHWNKYALNGNTLIIFPFLQLFFGELQDNQPIGICCFQINENERIIFEADQTIVVQIMQNQSITVFERKKQSYQLKSTFYVKSKTQELNVLSKIFKKEIFLHQIQFEEFIKFNFTQKYPQFEELSNKTDNFFGFKNSSSLGFRFQNNFPTSIGNFSKFPRNLIFGRKIYKSSFPKIQVEQGKFDQPVKTFAFPLNIVSIESQKFHEEYFKKSTIFRNQFTKLDHIGILYQRFKKIEKSISFQNNQRYGQQTLQSGNKEQQVFTKQFTLSEVRQQIYKAAEKKRHTYRVDRSPILLSKRNNISTNSLIEGFDDGRSSQRSRRKEISKNRYKYVIIDQIPHSFTDEKEILSRAFQRSRNQKPFMINEVDYLKNTYKSNDNNLQNQFQENSKTNQQYRRSRSRIIQLQSILQKNEQPYRKYKKYEVSRSPFRLQNQKGMDQNKKSLKKTYKYSASDRKQNIPLHSKSPYQRLKSSPNKKNNLKQNSPIVKQFDLNLQNEYKNLTKYKARKKQQGKYGYLDQNQKIQPMKEIKLFEKQNKFRVNYEDKHNQRSSPNFDNNYKINRVVREITPKRIKRTFNYVE